MSTVDIYLAFLAPKWRSDKCCYWPTTWLIDCYSGPFVHVLLILPPTHGMKKDEARAVHITGESGRVIIHKTHLRHPGYCYLKIILPTTSYLKLMHHLQMILNKNPPAQFSYMLMYGLTKEKQPINDEKEHWYCADIIGYLLQCGDVIEKNINVSNLSVTELFLITAQTSVNNITVRSSPGPLQTASSGAVDVYCRLMGRRDLPDALVITSNNRIVPISS